MLTQCDRKRNIKIKIRVIFATNEERKQHLEKYAHGDMYDTASTQEREDIRRFSNTLVDFNKK
jgi:hypothetical protein